MNSGGLTGWSSGPGPRRRRAAPAGRSRGTGHRPPAGTAPGWPGRQRPHRGLAEEAPDRAGVGDRPGRHLAGRRRGGGVLQPLRVGDHQPGGRPGCVAAGDPPSPSGEDICHRAVLDQAAEVLLDHLGDLGIPQAGQLQGAGHGGGGEFGRLVRQPPGRVVLLLGGVQPGQAPALLLASGSGPANPACPVAAAAARAMSGGRGASVTACSSPSRRARSSSTPVARRGRACWSGRSAAPGRPAVPRPAARPG